MKIQLERDTIVRHKAGEVLELPEEECRRLMAFGLASPVAEEPKKTTRKKTKEA